MFRSGLPHKGPPNPKILVYQNVPQTHDVKPWHGAVPGLELRTKPRNCLTNDRQLLGDSVTKRLVSEELSLPLTGNRFRYPIQSFQNVS